MGSIHARNSDKRKKEYLVIYFAEAVGVGLIKIGFTESLDAEVRLATLQTGSPVPLRLLGTMEGTIEEEKDLHRRFGEDSQLYIGI